MKIVRVFWIDSNARPGWHGMDCDVSPSECSTVGYLLRSNRKNVTLCMSKSDQGNIGDIVSIPHCTVRRIETLKAKEE